MTATFSNDTTVVSVKGGYCVVLFTLIAFNVFNRVVSIVGVPSIILKHATKKEDEAWKWKNLTLSWLHAAIVGTWDLSCFYFYPEIWQDLMTHITPFTYYLVAFSTGYFIYDFSDLVLQRKVFKLWELSLHHIAVISIFVYNLSTRSCIGYTVVALLTEVNSIFLHLRKLLQMLRLPFSGLPYRVNAVANLASFLLFRGFSLSRITYGMVVEWSRLDTAYLCMLGGAMFVMNAINPALFWLLLKSDVLRRAPRHRQRKVDSEVNGKVE